MTDMHGLGRFFNSRDDWVRTLLYTSIGLNSVTQIWESISEVDDKAELQPPRALSRIQAATAALKFPMGSEEQTGSLLRTLAATKPASKFLEIGTGTGLATAWMLEGMDAASHLTTIELAPELIAVAQKELSDDPRVTFVVGDAVPCLQQLQPGSFDFIFADTWPGKYTHLDLALNLLKAHGLYVIDDMLPQASWPEDHPPKVAALIRTLETRADLRITKLCWASGIIVCVKGS